MCFFVPVFACLTPFSHSLRSGSIPKGSNLCRLTCHSLSSDRPDGGKNLRGHDDHGVLPAEQNQALAGPPRRAGTAVRRVALSLQLRPTLLKWSAGRRTAPKTAGVFELPPLWSSSWRESSFYLGVGGAGPAGGDKNISTNQDAMLPSAGQSESFPSPFLLCLLAWFDANTFHQMFHWPNCSWSVEQTAHVFTFLLCNHLVFEILR